MCSTGTYTHSIVSSPCLVPAPPPGDPGLSTGPLSLEQATVSMHEISTRSHQDRRRRTDPACPAPPRGHPVRLGRWRCPPSRIAFFPPPQTSQSADCKLGTLHRLAERPAPRNAPAEARQRRQDQHPFCSQLSVEQRQHQVLSLSRRPASSTSARGTSFACSSRSLPLPAACPGGHCSSCIVLSFAPPRRGPPTAHPRLSPYRLHHLPIYPLSRRLLLPIERGDLFHRQHPIAAVDQSAGSPALPAWLRTPAARPPALRAPCRRAQARLATVAPRGTPPSLTPDLLVLHPCRSRRRPFPWAVVTILLRSTKAVGSRHRSSLPPPSPSCRCASYALSAPPPVIQVVAEHPDLDRLSAGGHHLCRCGPHLRTNRLAGLDRRPLRSPAGPPPVLGLPPSKRHRDLGAVALRPRSDVTPEETSGKRALSIKESSPSLPRFASRSVASMAVPAGSSPPACCVRCRHRHTRSPHVLDDDEFAQNPRIARDDDDRTVPQ